MAGIDLGRPWPEGNYETAFLKRAQLMCFRLEDDADVLSSVNIYSAHPSVVSQAAIGRADDDSRPRRYLDQR